MPVAVQPANPPEGPYFCFATGSMHAVAWGRFADQVRRPGITAQVCLGLLPEQNRLVARCTAKGDAPLPRAMSETSRVADAMLKRPYRSVGRLRAESSRRA